MNINSHFNIIFRPHSRYHAPAHTTWLRYCLRRRHFQGITSPKRSTGIWTVTISRDFVAREGHVEAGGGNFGTGRALPVYQMD